MINPLFCDFSQESFREFITFFQKFNRVTHSSRTLTDFYRRLRTRAFQDDLSVFVRCRPYRSVISKQNDLIVTPFPTSCYIEWHRFLLYRMAPVFVLKGLVIFLLMFFLITNGGMTKMILFRQKTEFGVQKAGNDIEMVL